MFIQGVFFNWDPLKVSEFTYQLTHRIFRGAPVKKDTLYLDVNDLQIKDL